MKAGTYDNRTPLMAALTLARAQLLAILLLFPLAACAESGNWLLLGVAFFVLPPVVIFLAASTVIWFICPARVRPWAIAICAIPLSPISNGSFWWPLSTYLIQWDPLITAWDLIWPVIVTFVVTYLAARLFSHPVWRWGVILAALRILIFIALHGQHTRNELEHQTYWLFWVLDFPISITYFIVPSATPLLEAIIGPIWWLFVPAVVSRVLRRESQRAATESH